MLVVDLCRELILLPRRLMVDTGSHLPAFLGLDIQVGKLPDISRRHDGGVRHFMDILVHGVETCLQRKVVLEGIAGRETDLRRMIGLDDTCLLTGLQQGLLRWQFTVTIDVHVTGSKRIEQGIPQTGRDRQPVGERMLIVDIGRTLQGLLFLQLIGRNTRFLSQRLILTCLHIVMLHGKTV